MRSFEQADVYPFPNECGDPGAVDFHETKRCKSPGVQPTGKETPSSTVILRQSKLGMRIEPEQIDLGLPHALEWGKPADGEIHGAKRHGGLPDRGRDRLDT